MTVHIPVLLQEVLFHMNIRPGQKVVDATLGGGGYSQALLDRIGPKGMLIAIDRDAEALDNFRKQSLERSAVQEDKLPDVGVPRIGVTSVGEVDNTLLPEPVLVVTPVPPLATASVPVTPEDKLTVPSVCFSDPLVSNVPSVVQVSPTLSVTFAIVRSVAALL